LRGKNSRKDMKRRSKKKRIKMFRNRGGFEEQKIQEKRNEVEPRFLTKGKGQNS